jgi:hypothetical protein
MANDANDTSRKLGSRLLTSTSLVESPKGIVKPNYASQTLTFGMNSINGCTCESASLTFDSDGNIEWNLNLTSTNVNNYYYIYEVYPYDKLAQNLALFAPNIGNFPCQVEGDGNVHQIAQRQAYFAVIYDYIVGFNIQYNA